MFKTTYIHIFGQVVKIRTVYSHGSQAIAVFVHLDVHALICVHPSFYVAVMSPDIALGCPNRQ